MMKNIYLFCLTIFFCVQIRGQFLFDHNNLYQISSINWVTSSTSQFVFFKNILIDNDILILSEANHGDGSTYDAQMAIIKELVDSGIVTTIYTESSWINIERINQELIEKGPSAIRTCRKYMRSVDLQYWVDKGFWDYIADKIIKGKIKLKGVDIAGVSDIIALELYNEALQIPDIINFLVANPMDSLRITGDFENFSGWGRQSNFRSESYMSERKFIEVVCKAYKNLGNNNRVRQWEGILNMFYWMYRRSLILAKNKYINVVENELQKSQFNSIRDSIMAEVFLRDYQERLQNEKAILLISSYHSIRNSKSIENIEKFFRDKSVYVFGDIISRAIKDSIYSVAFISANGERGIIDFGRFWKPEKIAKPLNESIEKVLDNMRSDYFFVNLQNNSFMDKKFPSNIVFDTYFDAVWNRHFSGLFFIKKMYTLSFSKPSEY